MAFKLKADMEIEMFHDLLFMSRDTGRVADFIRDSRTSSATVQWKYKFINKLIELGALTPEQIGVSGKTEYTIYRLDRKRVYKVFRESDGGQLAKQIFDKYSVIFID